ncbi:hypothetical protein GE061_004013 [Apolygus lucorum]|uniref:Uncharacterized protein n=1 Tax=Apolygus lucorum TaxID=248454 RepID=A0A8S9WXG2_APOLU|nr:hypothetical protein GE061_004013 [Apolygus lucorum]
MEDEIVVKEETISEGEETEGNQVMFEVVAVKQEELIGDEEEIRNSRSVKDEVAGYPMIKRELESTADPLSDGSDVLLGSIGIQTSQQEAPCLRTFNELNPLKSGKTPRHLDRGPSTSPCHD